MVIDKISYSFYYVFVFSWNIVNKNEDINLETNNAENNAIEYIERETDSETSETEIKMDLSIDFNGIFMYFFINSI